MIKLKKNSFKENPRILVSFKTTNEISDACLSYVDIFDLKDPNKGAIGCWEIEKIKRTVGKFGKKADISATLGDEKQFEAILDKLKLFDELKLNYIKFGIFVDNASDLLNLLNSIFNLNLRTELVPVIFAENIFMKNYLERNVLEFKKIGFNFLLLDTYSKESGDILKICSKTYLKKILSESSKIDLNIGFAGKLNENNISEIIDLQPQIVGFRSAVCKNGNRNSEFCFNRLKKLHQLIFSSSKQAMLNAGA